MDGMASPLPSNDFDLLRRTLVWLVPCLLAAPMKVLKEEL